MGNLTKLKDGPLISESFGSKPYLKELTLNEARINFRIRCKMTDLAWNYKHDRTYQEACWRCDSCQTCIETQEHVLICPAYAELREGKDIKNDRDLVNYMQKVMIIRDKLKITM